MDDLFVRWLVGAGAGTLFGPTLGKLGASLEAAGYRPSRTTSTSGSTRLISRPPPGGQKGFFQGAKVSLNPYVEAGAFIR